MPRDSNTLVGVGGWSYFPSRDKGKLSICSILYDFVEVNSTFYKLPNDTTPKRWKNQVRSDYFEFTVRANRKMTHENHLESTRENFKIFSDMLSMCEILNASVLHFQFPPFFEVDHNVISAWRDFFDSVGRVSPLHLAFEVRNRESANTREILSFFDDYDIIPVSDASRENPRVSSESEIMYTRLFGSAGKLGSLREIEKRIEEIPARKKYVAFHSITMYEDAFQMKKDINKDSNLFHKVAEQRPVA